MFGLSCFFFSHFHIIFLGRDGERKRVRAIKMFWGSTIWRCKYIWKSVSWYFHKLTIAFLATMLWEGLNKQKIFLYKYYHIKKKLNLKPPFPRSASRFPFIRIFIFSAPRSTFYSLFHLRKRLEFSYQRVCGCRKARQFSVDVRHISTWACKCWRPPTWHFESIVEWDGKDNVWDPPPLSNICDNNIVVNIFPFSFEDAYCRRQPTTACALQSFFDWNWKWI